MPYDALTPNQAMADRMAGYLAVLGMTPTPYNPSIGIGSSDVGNVSSVVPTLHPHVAIGPRGLVAHTPEFREPPVCRWASRRCCARPRLSPGLGADLLLEPDFMTRVRADFEGARTRGAKREQGISAKVRKHAKDVQGCEV